MATLLFRRFFAVFAGFYALGAVVSAQEGAADGPGLAFHALQFYGHRAGAKAAPLAAEGGEGAAGVAYKREFDRSSASYIGAQVVFKNQRVADNEHDYKVVIGLYTFAGQLISAREKSITVPPDWKYTWTSQSFGWPESGKWGVGTYRVKVWLDGTKVGEAAFYIHDDKAVIEPGVGELAVESLGFYEGGDFFRPGITKRPATSFARATTKRIYWVVGARNRLHNVRAHRPNMVGYFYHPDGTLMGEMANTVVVSPEVTEVKLFEGIGWSTPGSWEPGSYRFELEQDNRVVAERTFTITDPLAKPRTQPKVVHFGLLDGGVFAAGEVAPENLGKRVYSKEFPIADPGPLWAEIVVVNNPNHAEPHSHRVQWEWIGPDGSTLATSKDDFVIQPAWKTASHRHSHGGVEQAWSSGSYKVKVTIDGRLYKVLRFMVRDDDRKKAKDPTKRR